MVDGTDVLTVYREVMRAVEKARMGGGPTVLELVTLRMEGHAVHDDASYVPRELLAEYAEKDPVTRYRAWLELNEELGDDEQPRSRPRCAPDRPGRRRGRGQPAARPVHPARRRLCRPR